MQNNIFKKLSSLSIGKKLLAVAILAVLIFMTVFESVQFIYMRDYVLSQQEYSMEKTHVLSSELINKVIINHVEVMEFLTNNPTIIEFVSDSGDFTYNSAQHNIEFYSSYNRFMDVIFDAEQVYTEVDLISIYTQSGFIYNSDTRIDFSADEMRNTAWYKYMQNNNVISLWCDDAYLSPGEYSDDNMIHYIKLVRSKNNYNEYLGAIRISFYKNRLVDIIKSQEDNNISFLKNDRGEILACSQDGINGDFADAILVDTSHTDNVCSKFKYNGHQYLLITNTVEYTGWTFVNAINTDVFLRSYLYRMVILICIMLAIFILIVLLMNLSWKVVLKRLTVLIDAINKTNLDNLSVIDIKPSNDDVGVCINSYNEMIKRIQTLLDEMIENRRKLQRIEMDFLYEQLNPHFLFNTLSIINSMAIEHRNYDIQQSIEQISRYYRISLKNTELMIPLRDEIEHLKLYVDISNKRFSKNILFDYDVPDELLDLKVLKMLLQPVIENSVLHGFNQNTPYHKQNSIILVAYRKEKYIYIELMDNGIGISKEKLSTLLDPCEKHGIGLANTEKRIKLYYGNECGIQIYSEEGDYTRVLFTLTEDTADFV